MPDSIQVFWSLAYDFRVGIRHCEQSEGAALKELSGRLIRYVKEALNHAEYYKSTNPEKDAFFIDKIKAALSEKTIHVLEIISNKRNVESYDFFLLSHFFNSIAEIIDENADLLSKERRNRRGRPPILE